MDGASSASPDRTSWTAATRCSGDTSLSRNPDLPAAVISVYSWWQYILLGLAGLVIAVVAALGPASWAARTRTAFALRAE
jgi:ABC-type lipoprotein release transport system permease subunit